MNSLVCFALLGVASAAILPPLQQVADTADVAAAKARFFQLYREQAALAEAASDDEVINHQQQYSGAAVVHQAEPEHQVIVNSDGFVQNTAAVQFAINTFNAAYQAQLEATGAIQAEVIQPAVIHQAEPEHQAEPIVQAVSYSQQYTGPHATFNADGSAQNTAEVKAAAKAFFEAYQAQLALTGATQVQSVVPSVQVVSSNQQYNGPSAPINAEGHVENTAEVEAAALAFFEAYERQLEATASVETYVEPAQLTVEPLPVSAIVVDETAQQKAWALHLHAFKHALATTGDFTPEANLAKQAILQAYMEVSQRDY